MQRRFLFYHIATIARTNQHIAMDFTVLLADQLRFLLLLPLFFESNLHPEPSLYRKVSTGNTSTCQMVCCTTQVVKTVMEVSIRKAGNV